MQRSSFITLVSAAVVASAVLLGSCKGDNTVSNLEDVVFPDANISYDRTVQPLFNIACAVSGCHDTRTMASHLDLSSYQGIHQRFYDIVIPRDTSMSILVWSIESKNASLPMPPTRPLTQNQIRGLKQWILEGATDTIK